MEYAGFTKGSTAFAGLETWKSSEIDIDFVLNWQDEELLEFWRREFPPLFQFLIDDTERIMYWPGKRGENRVLLVKI